MPDFADFVRAMASSLDAPTDTQEFHIDLWYPRSRSLKRDPNEPTAVIVGLVDVRASGSIRITYDFDRDGYVIEVATVFSWPSGSAAHDRGWKEAAFVRAELPDEEENDA